MKRMLHKSSVVVLLWATLLAVPSVWADVGLLAVESMTLLSPCIPSTGHVIARKYHDLDGDAVRDGGEEWLEGFQFRLEQGGSEIGPWILVSTQTINFPPTARLISPINPQVGIELSRSSPLRRSTPVG